MMRVHTCPKHIAVKFDGPEVIKREARVEVITWLNGLKLEVGDRVYLPTNTSDLESFTKTDDGIAPLASPHIH